MINSVFLEIKTEKGRLSENQKIFIKNAQSLGHDAQVAYGWDDILEKIDSIIFNEKCA